jgi:hypothetical protein
VALDFEVVIEFLVDSSSYLRTFFCYQNHQLG